MYNFLKQLSQQLKTPSQHILRPFFNLKRASKILAVISFFLLSTEANAWFGSSDSDKKNETTENVNVPEDVQDEIRDIADDYFAKIRKENGFDDKAPFEEEDLSEDFKPRNVAEAMAMVSRKISDAISKNNFNVHYEPLPPIRKDVEAFKRFQWSPVEILTNLAEQAKETLFLDNKHQFSVEIRPFVAHTTTPSSTSLGCILTPRMQWSDRYISGQLFGSTIGKNGRDIGGSVTYGQKISNDFAAALTVAGGYNRSHFVRYDGKRLYRSYPKVWSIGASPMLVYYMPTKFPLDLFLGGDVYYSKILPLEESSNEETCHYDAQGETLYRVKLGPSYTMRREGKKRLYQIKLSIAGNVQSKIPDRFTATPNILFESQPLEDRGGYLFNLGFNLGAQKKSWSLAYGLRF